MLRWMTVGESHGPALVAVIEGVPAGLELQTLDFEEAPWRYRLRHGRGVHQKSEKGQVRILDGVRRGLTLGAPVATEITNSEWLKWKTVVPVDPVDLRALLIDVGSGDEREIARNKPLTRLRLGHADLVGMPSYELEDTRPVLERASVRETVACITLGAVAKAIPSQVEGVQLPSHAIQVGSLRAEEPIQPMPGDEEALNISATRTLDTDLDQRFRGLVNHAKANGDIIREIVEVIVWGVPTGLGSHMSAHACLDAKATRAFISVQLIKGVEIGNGFAQAAMFDSKAHDEILKGPDGHLLRAFNHVGGIEGGISDGQPIVVRVVFKAISTVPRALCSVGLANGEETLGLHQCSGTCQLVPGALIAQAELALVLADALFEHAGRKSIAEMRRNLEAYHQ